MSAISSRQNNTAAGRCSPTAAPNAGWRVAYTQAVLSPGYLHHGNVTLRGYNPNTLEGFADSHRLGRATINDH
jgi:hypothetical protein